MFKTKLFVITAYVHLAAGTAMYECLFGPDIEGEFVQKEVDSGVALNCGSFCQC